MTAQPLPALTSRDPSAWEQALYAFLVEKGNRSGSDLDQARLHPNGDYHDGLVASRPLAGLML
jgi:hypothetical protein